MKKKKKKTQEIICVFVLVKWVSFSLWDCGFEFHVGVVINWWALYESNVFD